MNIRNDVDRGLAIYEEIERLESELEIIESRLKEAGLNGDQVDLKDADRDGKQFLATGSKAIVPVVFTSDKIIGTFQANSQDYDRAIHGLGDQSARLTEFYKRTVVYKTLFDSGKKFRKRAQEILGADAPLFITAVLARDKDGIPKSDIKVCWRDQAVLGTK